MESQKISSTPAPQQPEQKSETSGNVVTKKKTPYVPPTPINTTMTQPPPVPQKPVVESPSATQQVKKHPFPLPYNPLAPTTAASSTATPVGDADGSSEVDDASLFDTNHAVRGNGFGGGANELADSYFDDTTMNDDSYCDTTTAGLDSIYYDDQSSYATDIYNTNASNGGGGGVISSAQSVSTSTDASTNYQDLIGNLPQDESNDGDKKTATTNAAAGKSKSKNSNNTATNITSKSPYQNYVSNNNDDDEDTSTGVGEEEYNGLLDFHQSGFDATAISAITSMTIGSADSQENPPNSTTTTGTTATNDASSGAGVPSAHGTSISQHEYPDEAPEPNSSSGMRFDELYRLKGVLGTGAFSTVREGFHKNSHHVSFAVKCINRKKLSEEDEAALLDEVSILKEMNHAHIIRIFDFFVEPSTYYLVMERMRGGELFDRIVTKAYYNEKEARDTCKIVLEAVSYCHENHVAHRDLKPENLLLLSDVDDSAVKIADFGFAKKVYEPNSLTTQCGTPGYVAPEILEGTAYDERADMWSVGVILYILLGGYPPFIESTQRDLFRKIRKGDYEFHEEYWGTVSSEAKELISSLLTVDRTVRLTADEALENAWILGDDAKLAQRDLGDNLNKLRNFNGKRKFRAAVSTVMAVNKLNLVGKEFFSHYGKNLAATTTDSSGEFNL